MANPTTFEIDLKSRLLKGDLHLPEESNQASPQLTAVLLCCPLEPEQDEKALLWVMTETLKKAGFAVVVFQTHPKPGSGPGSDGLSPLDAVDDASAAFRWMALVKGIDMMRLGVVGYSSGAAVAACLARRSDQIAGLCLIAPKIDFSESSNGQAKGNGRESATASGNELLPVEDAAHFDRPTIVLIPAADRKIPPRDATKYIRSLENAKHEVKHLLITRADHTFETESARALVLKQVTGFFSGMPSMVYSDQGS